MENFYSILDIPESASQEEIRQAYRMLLQVWHPDRFQHNAKLLAKAEQKAKEINAAFETLSNPILRQQYDSVLHESRNDLKESSKHEEESHADLTTKCPNPTCVYLLRVTSRSIGKVTCPTCRATFFYDPSRNEKWNVHCPATENRTDSTGNKAQDQTEPELTPGHHSQERSRPSPFVVVATLLLFIVAWIAIVLWNEHTANQSVFSNMGRIPVQERPTSTPLHATTEQPAVSPESTETHQQGSDLDYLAIANGEELVPPVFLSGKGQLTVVNDTAFDAVVKLYEDAKGGTLFRYWFVQSKRKATLSDLGPCNCSLYFALGKDWDFDMKGFRFKKGYGKYQVTLAFKETQTSQGPQSQAYLIRLVETPTGIERAHVVDEITFNELF